jgi:hypothetical protein
MTFSDTLYRALGVGLSVPAGDFDLSAAGRVGTLAN